MACMVGEKFERERWGENLVVWGLIKTARKGLALFIPLWHAPPPLDNTSSPLKQCTLIFQDVVVVVSLKYFQ